MRLSDSAIWLLMVPLLLAGCNGGLSSHLPSLMRAKPDKTSYQTPGKRIERLQQVAREAAGRTPAEQERLAVQLGQQLQNEQDPIVREQVVRALAPLQAPTAARLLGAALQDADMQVRIAAVEAIAERGGPGAVQVLSGVVQGETTLDVWLAAARALGELEDPAAMPALAMALESPDPALQYRAMQSLKQATGEDFGDDVAAWRQYAQGTTPTPKPVSFAEQIQRLNPF